MIRSVHPYRLPLTAPLVLGGVTHAHRLGVLLRLEDAAGRAGWGDAAPLPGFSAETAEEAAQQLHDLAAWAEHHPFARWDDPALDGLALAPSVRFALELALLDLASQREHETMAEHLRPSPATEVPLNALLIPDADPLAEASRLIEAGYQTIKVKVGRQHVDADADQLLALRERFPTVALRADANRAWSQDDASRFASRVRDAGLEYVEEPLAEASGLARLHEATGLPVALDESLVGVPVGGESDAVPPWAAAVVLKPTLLGGLARSMQFADAARKAGAPAVWSSAFESGVALRGLVAASAVTGAAPAGLDPYRRLAADVLAPRLSLDRPIVSVPHVLGPPHSVRLPAP